jgi:hypothetical protein
MEPIAVSSLHRTVLSLLPQAVAALGMQVAQTSSTPDRITVTALTSEGVRVQITLQPTGAGTSSLGVQGEAESEVLTAVATRLTEALAKQLAQQDDDAARGQQLRELGYIASDSESSEAR